MDVGENSGYVGTYHDEADWTGPEGFYMWDFREPIAADSSKTWLLYLWADPELYSDERMMLSFEAGYPDPSPERTYSVELMYVPDGITDAPPVGTTWAFDPAAPLSIEVPTYQTSNGLSSYQFAFTAGPMPEPTGVLVFLAGALFLRRR